MKSSRSPSHTCTPGTLSRKQTLINFLCILPELLYRHIISVHTFFSLFLHIEYYTICSVLHLFFNNLTIYLYSCRLSHNSTARVSLLLFAAAQGSTVWMCSHLFNEDMFSACPEKAPTTRRDTGKDFLFQGQKGNYLKEVDRAEDHSRAKGCLYQV